VQEKVVVEKEDMKCVDRMKRKKDDESPVHDPYSLWAYIDSLRIPTDR
jgi:hypothetical protein